MAHFVRTSAALSELEDLIDTAAEKLVLLSPYVRLSPMLRDRLHDADARGVEITLVYGKQELDPPQIRELSTFRNLTLLFSKRLHAKCYYNERRMIITSFNLLHTSESNHEMGVAVENGSEAYAAAVHEAEYIIKQAEPRGAVKKAAARPAAPRVIARTNASGFCIRCSKPIELNPEKPYCNDCFTVWARFENWDFEEKVCHRCGNSETTTRAKPQCYGCFKLSARH
jgi:hypothetical protein